MRNSNFSANGGPARLRSGLVRLPKGVLRTGAEIRNKFKARDIRKWAHDQTKFGI
ncbi:MAG: hypothetical protein AABZ02_04485 [Bacteroidota bacterium]